MTNTKPNSPLQAQTRQPHCWDSYMVTQSVNSSREMFDSVHHWTQTRNPWEIDTRRANVGQVPCLLANIPQLHTGDGRTLSIFEVLFLLLDEALEISFLAVLGSGRSMVHLPLAAGFWRGRSPIFPLRLLFSCRAPLHTVTAPLWGNCHSGTFSLLFLLTVCFKLRSKKLHGCIFMLYNTVFWNVYILCDGEIDLVQIRVKSHT